MPLSDRIEQYQFRNLPGRNLARGAEVRGDHWWLVVSEDATNQYDIFIAFLATHGRSLPPLWLFPPRAEPLPAFGVERSTRINLQQVWTFPSDRDQTVRPIPHLDEDTFLHSLNAQIKRRLTAPPTAMEPTSPFDVGRVVWIRLDTKVDDVSSDLHAVKLRLAQVYGSTWRPGSPLIPSVVLATSVHDRAENSQVLPLLTAVPMLTLPEFQGRYPNNPTVQGSEGKYSVLTQLLITVDYQARGRVEVRDGATEAWATTAQELGAIRKDVLGFMGVRA